MTAPNNPADFKTNYPDLISNYQDKIDVIKQEIRDLMADPVGAGMTHGAFLELIKDTLHSTPQQAVGYGTSDPAFVIAEKCDRISMYETAKAICTDLAAE